MSAYTMLMVTINAYAPVSQWLVEHGIRLSFLVFMAIVLVPIIIAYFLAWKLLVATFYRSSTEQFWEQSKEWTEKFKKIDEIEKTLKEILDRQKK
jgi:hypothetical protein